MGPSEGVVDPPSRSLHVHHPRHDEVEETDGVHRQHPPVLWHQAAHEYN